MPAPNSNFKLILGLALFLRLIFIAHPGFLADIAYWKWWTKDAAQNGLVHTITSTGINYPPLYLTVMKATGHVYSLFANLNDDTTYWDKSNLLFLFLIKLPYIISDLTIGYLIYSFLKKQLAQETETKLSVPLLNLFTRRNLDEGGNLSSLPLLAASLWLFNPGVIYDSALWGQTDSLGALPILAGYLSAILGYPLLAGIFAGVSFFLKAQSIPLILFLFVYLFLRYGLTASVKSAAASVAAGITVTLPYLVSHSMDRIVGTIVGSVGYFPWASLYAFNLWWLVVRGVSFQFPDQTLIFNLLTYRTVGFTLFWSAFIVLVLVLWHHRRDITTPKGSTIFFFTSSLLILASFLFPTEIHERYLLPFFAFSPIAIGLSFSQFKSSFSRSFLLLVTTYCLLSVSWLLNLHFVMIKNYPENNLPILSLLTGSLPTLSLWFSAANLVIFLILLYKVLGKDSTKSLLGLGVTIPLLLVILQTIPSGISAAQTPITLTSLTPTNSTIGWGTLHTNESVTGNNLAVSYFFSWTGIGTHAASLLDYNLDGNYSLFTTGTGLDIMGSDSSAIEFQIFGDDKLLARTGTVHKWDYPKFLSVGVVGVKKLTLFVAGVGDSISGDHADWLNPSLYK